MTDQFKPSALALPSGLSADMRRFLSAVKQTLEVRANQLGNPLDAAPTFRDLIDNGLLAVINGASIGGKNFSRDQLLNILTNNIPDWITSDTAPPAPTNLTVTTDKTNTVLRWDQSTFDQYGSTDVYRATTNNLSLAAKVGSASGNEFPDRLPDPGTIYYYWIAHSILCLAFQAFLRQVQFQCQQNSLAKTLKSHTRLRQASLPCLSTR